jgi:3D (Asp-Asp-Asp) domain-containing protein
MNRPLLLLITALLAAALGSSCAPNNGQFGLAPPSAKVIAEASSQPKDRHGMPIYRFEQKKRLVRTTAYTCTECDHLQYGNKSAAGTVLLYGRSLRSAAADWSYYPLGTKFRIKGLPYTYVIDDYGSALTGTATIDIYKPSHEVMNQWGLRKVEVQILEWGSMKRSVELLSQRTRYRHCRQMLSNILRIQPSLRQYAKLDEQPADLEFSLASAVLCAAE